MITFATGAGAAAIAAIATAAPTGGLSVPGATMYLMLAVPTVGASIETLVILITVIGLSAIALFKDYDVEFVFGDQIGFKAKKQN